MNKLLFIDDEKDILGIYKGLFSKKESTQKLNSLAKDILGDFESSTPTNFEGSFEVLTASQGEAGVNLVRQSVDQGRPISIAFIDMRMPPGIDGKETAKRIREIDPNIEIVIVTAFSDANLSEIVEEVGRPDKLLYLKKPFDVQEIKQLVLNLSAKRGHENSKDNLLANVTHELRTPLASILGFNELLLSLSGMSDEAREYLEMIESNARLLKSLTDDLIESIEMGPDHLDLVKESKDLKDVIVEAYKIMGPKFKQRPEVDFILDESSKTQKVEREVDVMRMVRCVVGLIDNAYKFTEKGHVHVGLREKEGKVEIYVSDTGCGIDENKKEHIFDQFYREENAHHTLPGLGLGLNIVKKITLAHGGRIEVVSKRGEGSTFTLVI